MAKGIVAVSLLAVGLLAGLPAQASVIYTSRSSTISGSSCQPSGVCTIQTQSSTGFSPMSASFSVPSDPDTNSSYTVSQQSTLTADKVTVSMGAEKQLYDYASSSFDLHFTVDAPSDFTMSGNLGYWNSSGFAQISLSGPSTFGLADSNCGSSGDFDSCTYSNQTFFPPPYSTKTLAPGLYELLITARDTGPD